jgi:hypothetical protein
MRFSKKTLRLSWRKILPIEDELEDQENSVPDPSVADYQSILLMSGHNLEENEGDEWL